MGIIRFFERLGYLRAAGHLQSMGYPALAEKLRMQAKELE